MKALTRKRTMMIAAALLAVPLMAGNAMADDGRPRRNNSESGHHRIEQTSRSHTGAAVTFARHDRRDRDHSRRAYGHNRGNDHRWGNSRRHHYRSRPRVYVPTYTVPCRPVRPVYRAPVYRRPACTTPSSGFSITLFFRD